MKRAYCLYRVSTMGQVEKDDIPMQRTACREFAQVNGWTILEELVEKGVSGFKVSSDDRKAMQKLKQDAIFKKFDVLLVFMFDRLGRRDDETPFIVEWFVKNGIEVWSATEGQQRFENHVDKLMNYIRYWQSSGESIKTSIRTKTRLGQIVQEGRFRGGTAPYGYRLEKQGRLNKKNHELYEILIDENESKVVETIFDLYLTHGYGSHRIASHLTQQGIFTRSGNNFTNTTIQHMLKNIMYIGILRSGESQSEPLPHLQIIDPHVFEQTQDMIAERSRDYADRRIPLNTRGSTLLSGNVFCGHCGARLVVTTNGKKYQRKDGQCTITPRIRYVCYNKTRHRHLCDGQTGYTAGKLDSLIELRIKRLFSQIKNNPSISAVKKRYDDQVSILKQSLSLAETELKKHQQEVNECKSEVINVIRGISKLDASMINILYAEAQEKVALAAADVAQLESELDACPQILRELGQQYDDLLLWSDSFESEDISNRKMIVSRLIKSVRVSRDYKLEIELHPNCEQFGLML